MSTKEEMNQVNVTLTRPQATAFLMKAKGIENEDAERIVFMLKLDNLDRMATYLRTGKPT